MRINSAYGVIAPNRVRRKRRSPQLPPWYVEVPPDTVDVALLPRVNRYQRGSLKFHQLGSTQRKSAERLEMFRETMGIVDPKLSHTQEEMLEGLKDIMTERARLLGLDVTEFNFDEGGDGEERDGEERDGEERDGEEGDRARARAGNEGGGREEGDHELKSLQHEQSLKGEDAVKHGANRHGVNRHGVNRHGVNRHGVSEERDEGSSSKEMFGQPTDWLVNRLNTLAENAALKKSELG